MGDHPPDSSQEPQRTVMVVDADILSRTAIADYLRHCGYRVIEGSSADDVDTVLGSAHTVDVVLVDLTLAGSQDGFSLSRRLRADYPDMLVILTSSAAKQAETAADLCEDAPLVKPYEPKELERRILMLRERRRQDGGTP
jgi:DNA-binding response OmpR family regulator